MADHETESDYQQGIDLLIPLLPKIASMTVPLNVDYEVCICGDVECCGACDLALWAVQQVISFLDATLDVDQLNDRLDSMARGARVRAALSSPPASSGGGDRG